jgi:hypothetical protein
VETVDHPEYNILTEKIQAGVCKINQVDSHLPILYGHREEGRQIPDEPSVVMRILLLGLQSHFALSECAKPKSSHNDQLGGPALSSVTLPTNPDSWPPPHYSTSSRSIPKSWPTLWPIDDVSRIGCNDKFCKFFRLPGIQIAVFLTEPVESSQNGAKFCAVASLLPADRWGPRLPGERRTCRAMW